MTRNFSPETQKRRSQAKANKENQIMNAALGLFSRSGLNGVSIEMIAEHAGVSKSNLLYYFANKETLYLAVIQRILDDWLQPLESFSKAQDPQEAFASYIKFKLEMSRDKPDESRLFCMEVLQGAPLILEDITSPLQAIVARKSVVIQAWIDAGKMADIDPKHLLFSIWATTQHYADFATQVKAITGKDLRNKKFFEETLSTLQMIFAKTIAA